MGTLLYYIVVPIVYLFSYLPSPILYKISDGIAFILYAIIGYRKQVATSNLRNSFPEKTTQEINQLVKESYTHLSDRIIENIKCITISKAEIEKRVIVKNVEQMHIWKEQHKNVVVLLGHIGSWEYAGYKASQELMGMYKCVGVVSLLTHPKFNQLIQSTRGKMGMELVGMRHANEFYKRKSTDLSAVFFLGDQAPSTPKAYWTKFLHQETPFFMGAERYARMHDCAVLYVAIKQTSRGYYEIELIKICDDPNELENIQITQKYTELLEKTLLENPSDWLWTHKRWKYKKPTSTPKIAS